MKNADSTSPAPVKKQSPIIKIIGILALGGLILVVGLIFAITNGIFGQNGPGATAKDFVNNVSSGNTTEAYEQTAEIFKEVTSEEDLNIFLEAYPVLNEATSYNISGFKIENNVAVVTGTVKGAGEESPLTFTLVKEDDEWEIVNFSLNPEDVPSFDSFDDDTDTFDEDF